MTIKKLILELSKRESLKKEVNIAQISEIVARLCDLIYDERTEGAYSETVELLVKNGDSRARKRIKKNRT